MSTSFFTRLEGNIPFCNRHRTRARPCSARHKPMYMYTTLCQPLPPLKRPRDTGNTGVHHVATSAAIRSPAGFFPFLL